MPINVFLLQSRYCTIWFCQYEKYHKEIFNLINNSEIKKCLFICDKNEKNYTNYLKDKKKFLVLNNIKDVPKEINKSIHLANSWPN